LEKEGFNPIYVNVDGCGTCQYPDYRNLEKSVRNNPNEQAWKSLLKNLNINYLLVGINNYHSANNPLFEQQWADHDPGMFKKLLSSNEITLYKINK
jgi:hypothetical protein